jgi:hypothetical protein
MANFTSRPSTRQEHADFCLRQLGFPVIDVNIDDQQVEDAIDLSLQYFQDFHYDGIEHWYTKHQITADDKTNGWIPVTENIIGVTRIFPIASSNASINMFDLRYQMRLHELYDFTSTSFVNYAMTMQHIRTIEMLFTGEAPVRFNRHTDKLYIDMDWTQMDVGEYLVVEGFLIVDPDTYSDVWNDRMLKNLTTAYLKKQWGTNMKKFGGIQLPGGVTLNGQQMYDEAVRDIATLEDQIKRTYSAPPRMLIG